MAAWWLGQHGEMRRVAPWKRFIHSTMREEQSCSESAAWWWWLVVGGGGGGGGGALVRCY